jgi:FecR protein
MMHRDCVKWSAISDAAVLGEPVSSADREFELEHQATCARCRGEASIWASLRPSRLQLVPSEDEVEEVLSLVSTETYLVEPPARVTVGPRALAATAALLAMAAGLVLWLKTPGKDAADQGMGATAAAYSPPVTTAVRPPSPSVTQGALPTVKARHYATDTCSDVVDGITLCFAAGSEVSSMELLPPHRVVRLVRGRAVASLVPQAPGTSFSIATKDGSVTAVGTQFTVEVGSHGESLARVHHGKVVVRGSRPGAETFLVAGQATRLGSEKIEAVAAPDRSRDVRLLSRADRPAGVTAAPSKPSPEAPNDELERARELRSKGRFREAAQVYRAIHSASPHSSAGRTALISLGSLSLSTLGDPQAALMAFSGYLSGGPGALTKEAAYGRLRALRALGRTAEADAATESYLSQYPDGPESATLRRSLSHGSAP